MNRLALIIREMRFRPLSVAVSALAIAVAVAALFLCLAALRSFELETEQLAGEVQAATEAEVEKINNQIRKSMKGLGFNIFIYPETQDLAEVFVQGYADETMPEEYVMRLATSKVVTVNHLLPRLSRKIHWAEHDRMVMLIGVRGEVPLAHKDPKKPLIDPVAPGEAVLGHALWAGLNLKVGDSISMRGKSFRVSACHPERGTVDDVTVWISLDEAQGLLDLPGRISSILALQCNCASLDRLGEVRKEVGAILPGTRIIEKGSRALARAEARTVVEKDGEARLAQLKKDREKRRSDREGFFSLLLPLITLSSTGWVLYLAWANVRERRVEIGTLRAMGVQGSQILMIFMGKAFWIGSVGGILGLVLAVGVSVVGADRLFAGAAPWELVPVGQWVALLITTPAIAMAASWLPAMQAAQNDPVEVLRGDG